MAATPLREMSAAQFLAQEHKRVTLMGMSGVGKTTLARVLPKSAWFHYSADYRIGTRYLDEPILDNIKKMAMQVPFLAELLRSDSIYICHNITVENLSPISTFLGMVGNPTLGGLSLEEFKRRLALHRDAEIRAMYDVRDFIHKARDIYGYAHFLHDASGSLCELDDEATWARLAEDTIIVYLRAPEAMREELVRRAIAHPKPLYYQARFLDEALAEYMSEKDLTSTALIDPADFVRWVFPRLVAHRLPLYQYIADHYGVTVDASRVTDVHDEADFLNLIAEALDARRS